MLSINIFKTYIIKMKKILIRRSRMFEDKTKELDDPGMLALSKLSEAF